ncbi:MAG: cytidine/deoxycytidylate deaminase family protein, partial [Planctomycetota bacterium]
MDPTERQHRRDAHLLRISKMFAQFSTCLSRKVGCVIASDAGHVISTGYNGAPKKTRHSDEAGCFCQEPGRVSGTFQERLRCSHAELNAIAQAAYEGVSTRGARIYCVTFPCSFCCKAIIQAGLRHVIYEEDYDDELSRTLFEEAGVECRQIIPT